MFTHNSKICAIVLVVLDNPAFQITLEQLQCYRVHLNYVACTVVIHTHNAKSIVRMDKLFHSARRIQQQSILSTTVDAIVVKQALPPVHRILLVTAQPTYVNQVHVVFPVLYSIQVNAYQIRMDKRMVYVSVPLQLPLL